MHDKERTDWLAWLIVLLIFGALFAGIMALAQGERLPVPFVD
ncbi:MAG: hypothetical protein AB1673_09985 [Actinomycetota bacterium]|jgi:hypothetical protein